MGRCFYKFHSDEVIRLTGIVAIEAAYLDLLIGMVLAMASGSDRDVTKNAEFGDATSVKVKRLWQFAVDLPDDVKAAMKLLPSILSDRDHAVHGISVVGEDGDKIDVALRNTRTGRKAGDADSRDAAWLSDLVDRMSSVIGPLLDYITSRSPSAIVEVPAH